MLLPPRLPLRVLRCPPRGRTPPWGGPAVGLCCPPQDLLCLPWTNLADQAGGAFGAAASRRRPQAGGQPQHQMPRRPGPRHGPAAPPSCTVSQTNLPDQAGGAFGAAASRRRPQAGGQPQRRMPHRPGPRHHPATPPSRSHPNLALSAAGLLPPRLPLRVLRCPPRGGEPRLGAARRRAYLARARRASLMPSLTPTSWGSALSAAAASRSL